MWRRMNGSGGGRRRQLLLRRTFCLLLLTFRLDLGSAGNPDAKRLYDDLLSNYNKLVRPVVNVTDALTVKIKLKLSQLIDVNLKNQIMTTNLWVEQFWYDYKLTWDPNEYGGVKMLHVPSDHIWRPDIVLYNNADGNFEVTLATKATLYHNGLVEWKPPAIYKSSCEIDVEYFPFDEQTCVMKFGSWTYDGFQVDLRHIDEVAGVSTVEIGVDLSEFYMSVEWDILEVPAIRNERFYTCCNEPYLDITFNITMRRKTLFYTVNLIIPCMGISFLTLLVFYLPSDSGEKVSLSISILLSLTVFFLLLAEIIPPTSLVVPLLGKFVLFTMILDTVSICVTVVVLNVHFRTPQTHTMAPWVRRVFLHILPRLLVMRRPQYYLERMAGKTVSQTMNGSSGRLLVRTCNGLELRPTLSMHDPLPYRGFDSFGDFLGSRSPHDYSPTRDTVDGLGLNGSCKIHGMPPPPPPPPPVPPSRAASQHPLLRSTELHDPDMEGDTDPDMISGGHHHHQHQHHHSSSHLHQQQQQSQHSERHHRTTQWPGCPEIAKAVDGVRYIAEHTRREEESIRVKEDWKYVAMVLDRLFLWIFSLAVLAGTAGIILQAPTLYDDRVPIDVRLSEIASATAKPSQAANTARS